MEHKGGRSVRHERHPGQENTPQAVIKRATGSFDLYSLIEGVNVGAAKLASGNKADLSFGRAVIDGIAGYLRSFDVVHKALYPQDVDFQEARMGLMGMVDGLIPRFVAIQRHPSLKNSIDPNVVALVNIVRMMPESEGQENPLTPIFGKSLSTNFLALITGVSTSGSIRAYQEGLLRFTRERSKCLAELGGVKIFATDPLPNLKAVESFDTPEYSFYRTKFGGLSYADLFTSDKTTPEDIFRFLRACPPGDLLRAQINRDLFFSLFLDDIGGHAEQEFHGRKDVYKKVFDFQRWLGFKLIGPTIDSAYADPRFDKDFIEMLNTFNGMMDVSVAGVVNIEWLYEGIARSFIDSEVEAGQMGFYDYALAAYLDRHSLSKVSLSDMIAQEWLNDNNERILANLRGRFRRPHFIDMFAAITKNDFRASHTKILYDELAKHVDGDFYARLESARGQIAEVNQLIWKSMQSNVDVAYLPDEAKETQIVFSETSFPRQLGLRGVSFVPSYDEFKAVSGISFRLFTSNPNLNVVGAIDRNGRLAELSADLSKTPGLDALVENIVDSCFRDIVIRKRIVREPKKSSARGINRTTDKVPDKTVEKTATYHTPLPRRIYEPAEEELTSDNLTSDIVRERQKTGYKPRVVSMQKRRLSGAVDYLRLVKAYNALSTEEKNGESGAELMGRLTEARAHLNRPSPNKIASTPAMFVLEQVDDPGLYDYKKHEPVRTYVDTWHVAYTSPKPEEGEQKSATTMYRRYYEGGSAFQFLDQYLRIRLTNND